MHLIWTLIIGGIIGMIAGSITGLGGRMGCLMNIIAGLLGAWLGVRLLGNFGWQIAGIPLIPALVGAVVLVIILSFFWRI